MPASGSVSSSASSSSAGRPSPSAATRSSRKCASAERAEIVAAILGGEGYESLWERTPTT